MCIRCWRVRTSISPRVPRKWRCIGPAVLSAFDPEINSKWSLTAVIMFAAAVTMFLI